MEPLELREPLKPPLRSWSPKKNGIRLRKPRFDRQVKDARHHLRRCRRAWRSRRTIPKQEACNEAIQHFKSLVVLKKKEAFRTYASCNPLNEPWQHFHKVICIQQEPLHSPSYPTDDIVAKLLPRHAPSLDSRHVFLKQTTFRGDKKTKLNNF